MTATKSNPLQTVLTIVLGLLLLYWFSRIEHFLSVALVIGLIGLISPVARQKIDFLWMKLAWVLSLIIPNILLSLVFFGILTPIAFFSSVFGKKDALQLKNKEKSLYVEVDKTFDKDFFKKPW